MTGGARSRQNHANNGNEDDEGGVVPGPRILGFTELGKETGT